MYVKFAIIEKKIPAKVAASSELTMAYLLAPSLALFLTSAAASELPNIVYVMTDDQDVELGGLTPMKNVRELLGSQGAVGEAFYIATPICCPSRTETLSGRLYHNVLTDDLDGCMHVDSTKYIFNHSSSLFPQLQSAGYITGGFGKVRYSNTQTLALRHLRHSSPAPTLPTD